MILGVTFHVGQTKGTMAGAVVDFCEAILIYRKKKKKKRGVIPPGCQMR